MALSGMDQGDERKRTTDEVSKTIRRRQNWGPFTLPGKVQRKPVYGLDGVRHAGGVNLKPGSCVERGNLSSRCEGRNSSGETSQDQEYLCGTRGGLTRSSVEVSAMAVKSPRATRRSEMKKIRSQPLWPCKVSFYIDLEAYRTGITSFPTGM
jgi:hypothetical protein